MPLRPIEFVSRGGNALLTSLLNRSAASLTQALSDGVQLTRDANNNQLVQERNALAEIRFDRGFREDQFRDRRDFGRRVFTEDRSFGENVRQFNILDSDRDADRALRAELGRGNLGIQRSRLDLERQRTSQALSEGELRLESLRNRVEQEELGFEDDRVRREELRVLRERERVANDPELFANSVQDPFDPRSQDEIDVLRERELESISRGYLFYDRAGNAAANLDSARDVGVLPDRDATIRGRTSIQSVQEAELLLEDGNTQEALTVLRRAASEAEDGSPQQVEVLSTIEGVTAQRQALLEGSSLSREAAQAANKAYTESKNTAFPNASSFQEAVREVQNAVSREEYIRAVKSTARGGDRSATGTNTIARQRAAFYDAVKASSDQDRKRVRAQGDPYEAELEGL